MVNGLRNAAYASLTIFILLSAYIFFRKFNGQVYIPIISIIATILLFLGIVLFFFYKKFNYMRDAFNFADDQSISWKIIYYIAEHVRADDGQQVLDVGCGSGALSIAVAKNNSRAKVTGVDKWGASYKTFSKQLCESNAKAEGIDNAVFVPGDAVALAFADESFDVIVSNYVYHNIPGDRQKHLLESLRLLKKGGQFYIHDFFTSGKYGDMNSFIEKLKEMGYQKVELIDTDNGAPMQPQIAKKLMLNGSKLFCGIK